MERADVIQLATSQVNRANEGTRSIFLVERYRQQDLLLTLAQATTLEPNAHAEIAQRFRMALAASSNDSLWWIVVFRAPTENDAARSGSLSLLIEDSTELTYEFRE